MLCWQIYNISIRKCSSDVYSRATWKGTVNTDQKGLVKDEIRLDFSYSLKIPLLQSSRKWR